MLQAQRVAHGFRTRGPRLPQLALTQHQQHSEFTGLLAVLSLARMHCT